jgi:hypothetical protein
MERFLREKNSLPFLAAFLVRKLRTVYFTRSEGNLRTHFVFQGSNEERVTKRVRPDHDSIGW